MQKTSRKLTLISVLLYCAVVPLILFFSLKYLSPQMYYIPAAGAAVCAVIPFFFYFEKRKIKTTEIAVLSVMTALCTVSRTVFAFLPQVKPMCAFVITSAVAFGGNVGFVVGALSVLISNFFFGQGMYTPFQMLGMGLTAFICALMFYRKSGEKNRLAVSVVGAVLCFFVYGFVVDTCSVLMMTGDYTLKGVTAVYLSGMPFNLIHALSTAVTLFIIHKPMNDKFSRLREKYGVFG